MCRSRQLGSCVAPVLGIIIALVARSAVVRRPIAKTGLPATPRLDSEHGIERLGSRCWFWQSCGLACRTPRPHPPIFDIGATTNLPQVSGDYTGAASWTFSFDVFYSAGNYVDTWLRFRYQDGTFNGWHLDVENVFPNSWQVTL